MICWREGHLARTIEHLAEGFAKSLLKEGKNTINT